MEWSLDSELLSHNILFKPVHNFLSNPANRQTNTQTNKQTGMNTFNIRQTPLANVMMQSTLITDSRCVIIFHTYVLSTKAYPQLLAPLSGLAHAAHALEKPHSNQWDTLTTLDSVTHHSRGPIRRGKSGGLSMITRQYVGKREEKNHYGIWKAADFICFVNEFSKTKQPK